MNLIEMRGCNVPEQRVMKSHSLLVYGQSGRDGKIFFRRADTCAGVVTDGVSECDRTGGTGLILYFVICMQGPAIGPFFGSQIASVGG